MNSKSTRKLPRDRARRRERKLWHNSTQNTGSLGCLHCPTHDTCGGLNVGRSLYSCLDYCCGGKPDCDVVCRYNTNDFVDRVREIGGFELDNVLRGRFLLPPKLANVVPLVFHRHARTVPLKCETVAVPLSALVDHKRATARYRTIEQVREAFQLSENTSVIATGTATDPPLEKWWMLGDTRRKVVRQLANAGITFASSPNYSLFSDQPRWDDLHSIKRIAIAHQEFLAEGLPCALHVNARTETDMKRWTEFVCARPEIQHIAYEFLTGAGWRSRRQRHVEWLEQLAKSTERPLILVLRGATEMVPRLSRAFDQVIVIESTAFMRAVKRQRGISTNRAPTWHGVPTPIGTPIDDFLANNIDVMERWISSLLPDAQLRTAKASAV